MTKKELKAMYLKTFLTINRDARSKGLVSFSHINNRLTFIMAARGLKYQNYN